MILQVNQYECIVLWWCSAVFSFLFRLQRLSLDTYRRLYFQQFFSLHRHHVEHCDIVRCTKKFICSKDIENIDVESCCFWCCCWCIRSTSFHIISGHIWLQMNNPSSSIYYLTGGVIRTLLIVPLLSVVAISADRFLAVHLHLRYKELVTHRRVVTVVISIWVFCAFFSLMMFWVSTSTRAIISTIFHTIGFLLTTLINIRIHFIVRQHKFQIQSLQLQEADQCREVKRLAVSLKSAGCILYVYFMFLVSYLPLFSPMLAMKINGPNSTIRSLNIFAIILVFLNSTLNPPIYCWKMRHIHHSVIDILCTKEKLELY